MLVPLECFRAFRHARERGRAPANFLSNNLSLDFLASKRDSLPSKY